MNILIDICHPAHVHYFKYLYFELRSKHNILVTCKHIPIVMSLLSHYDIPFHVLGQKGDGILAKAMKQVLFVKRMISLIHSRSIDLAIGSSATAVHAAKFTRAKSILFDDDDQAVQPLTSKFVSPYADVVLSPDTLSHESLPNALYYPGYQELAYLHPNRFKPDKSIREKYGISDCENYFVLRFNAFKAHHDINEGGMSMKQKEAIISTLKKRGRVFITSETKLESDFEEFRIPIKPFEMHDFMYYSRMLISDSQTMSSEASVLGIPSYRCNSFVGRISYLEEEEKRYGLTKGFLPTQFSWMLESIESDLDSIHHNQERSIRHDQLLDDKIDVTSFWTWFIEEYPESLATASHPKFDFIRFGRRS